MAVELTRSPIGMGLSRQASAQQQAQTRTIRPYLKLISNNQLQTNTSKAAFNTSMERALLSQKYWDELLEKLRRAGGGGGGGNDKRFDRVAVSMMLSNFLSNKTIQAMLQNFGVELFDLNQILNQSKNVNQNVSLNIIQNIGKMILNNLTNAISLIIRRDVPSARLYTALIQLSSLIELISFQLKKLKEILEEDLKEAIKKLDVKEKMRKIKAALTDFFVEMKDELLNFIEFVKSDLLFQLNVNL